LIDLPVSIYQPQSALGFAAAVYRNANFDATTVRTNIAAAANTYLSPNTYPFGRVIYMPDLIKIVEATQGVDRVQEINGVPAVGTNYQACPASLTFTNGSASATTGSTTGYTAGQSFIIDVTNNAVYLITAFVANTSVTFDRAWAGTGGAATPNYFTSKDDDMNGGTNNPLWYAVPYSNLSTTTAPASIVVVGSV
jgi:hypothetical protein